MYFPSTEINYYNIKNLEKNNQISRLEVLSRIIGNDNFIITTSLDALRNKLTPKKIFKEKS